MAALNLSPKNPLIVIGLVGVAAYLLTRRATAATQTNAAANVSASNQRYANPVDQAAAVARGVIAVLNGFTPKPTPNMLATQADDARNRSLLRDFEGDYYGVSSDPVTTVADLRKWDATHVDAVSNAGVYDVSWAP